MTNELILVDEFDQMQEVSKRIAKGESFTQVGKALGIKRAQVIEIYEQWKNVAVRDDQLRERARTIWAEADTHYDDILQEMWDIVHEAQSDGTLDALKVRNAAAKNIADVTAKRVDFIQRAGMLEDAEIGNQIMETEQKAEAIKQLLKQIANDYPDTREAIATGLTKIFNEPSGVTVVYGV